MPGERLDRVVECVVPGVDYPEHAVTTVVVVFPTGVRIEKSVSVDGKVQPGSIV